MHHLVLYDFAIHWFDIVTQLLPNQRPTRVYASNAIAPGQRAKPPLLGQVGIEFEQDRGGAQATLVFDGRRRSRRSTRRSSPARSAPPAAKGRTSTSSA